MGRTEDALKAHELAIKRMPPNSPQRIRMEDIKKKI